MVKEERYDDRRDEDRANKSKKRKSFDEIGYNREKDRRRKKLRYDKENKGFKEMGNPKKRFRNESDEDELFEEDDDLYDYPE